MPHQTPSPPSLYHINSETHLLSLSYASPIPLSLLSHCHISTNSALHPPLPLSHIVHKFDHPIYLAPPSATPSHLQVPGAHNTYSTYSMTTCSLNQFNCLFGSGCSLEMLSLVSGHGVLLNFAYLTTMK